MGLFKKKQTFALSDILKGVQYAINSAQEMLHAQQVQNLMKFWQSNSCENQQERKVYPYQVHLRRKEIHLPRCVPNGFLGGGVINFLAFDTK